ncbi:alpha-glucosidase/alpha-galactosidase [candidate division KSB1 bacterium]|nr:alpha-glucosidase/alpha-galactosidase [candidate division KSB1 bacterium]
MQKKIAYIGAASLAFGPKLINDAILCPDIKGWKLTLMDIDEVNLEIIYKLANKLNAQHGQPLEIERTTDRRKALSNADFIIISIAKDRFERWNHDMEIPKKYGIHQAKAETGGPGAISLVLRNMPMIIDICRDVEQICPDAWVLNYTNPVNTLGYGMEKYANVKWIGLCDGIFGTLSGFGRLFETDRKNIEIQVAGINHCTWLQDLRFKDTGENLLPRLPEMLAQNPQFNPACQFFFKHFGIFPCPGDHEVCEYFSFGRELLDKPGFIYEERVRDRKEHRQYIKDLANDKPGIDPENLGVRRSDEIALDFITAILFNRGDRYPSGIVPNRGNIYNLPYDSIVEVPIFVDASGVRPLKATELPEPVARHLALYQLVQQLSVDAAVNCSREIAMQAMLLEPSVNSARAAQKMLEEFLEVHRDVLPGGWYR